MLTRFHALFEVGTVLKRQMTEKLKVDRRRSKNHPIDRHQDLYCARRDSSFIQIHKLSLLSSMRMLPRPVYLPSVTAEAPFDLGKHSQPFPLLPDTPDICHATTTLQLCNSLTTVRAVPVWGFSRP